MGLGINTNVASLNAQRNLSGTTNSLNTSLQRLSTGLRINSAKDDAAGLAISERMTSQIRGLNQAVRNSNDAISMAQTAEGAMQEVTNILQRMRELSVQSANDTNTATDRVALQSEVTQLQSELNRISETTTFNGKNLLDGTLSSQSFQVGADAGQTINVSIDSTRSTNIGNNADSTDGTFTAAVNTGTTNTVAAQTLTVSGTLGSAGVTVAANDSARTIASSVNADTASTGVSASASTTATLDTLSAAGTVTLDVGGDGGAGNAVTVSAAITNTADLRELADAINDVSSTTGVYATATSTGGSISLTNNLGDDISIANFAVDTAGNQTVNLTGGSGAAATLTEGGADTGVVAGSVDFSSTKGFTIQTSAAGTVFAAATNTSSLAAVSSVDVSSQSGADTAITIIDSAITAISANRADLGAVQNRLESTINNLSTTSENVSAARGRIRDADFAAETAELTRQQILQQAGISMMAQANSAPQSVLSLLR